MFNNLGSDIQILDNSLTQIFDKSETWLMLEYYLQMTLRTSRVKLIQAWVVSALQTTHKFEKKNAGKLVLKTFIDTASLDAENTIQNICTRGFSISKKGLKLSFGNFNLPGFPLIPMNKANKENGTYELTSEKENINKQNKLLRQIKKQREKFYLSGERNIFEFFLCDVGVGLSLSVNESDLNLYNRDILPIEYDSIFIKTKKKYNKSNNSSNNNNSDYISLDDSLTIHYIKKKNNNELNEQDVNLALGGNIKPMYGVLPYYTYNHEYIIYDSSQILPKYLIQFECDPCIEEYYAVPLCEYCNNASSLYYCESDNVKLCEKCDAFIHSQNKLVKKHIRITLDEAQTELGECKIHLQNIANMFCTICHIPICDSCLPSHVHNNLLNNENNLININNDAIISLTMAYKAIIQQSKKPPKAIQQKKKKLNHLLNKIDQLYDQVSSDMKHVEQNMYTILENLVKQLYQVTDKKMSSVLSEEFELKRQYKDIIFMEKFLFYLESILPPADFMDAWFRHCQCRTEFQLNSNFLSKMHSIVFPDILIKGNINIVTEDTIEHEIEQAH
ncbi:zinc finger protein, putative [Hepatocystis sp. ex Piliocolobus tephrosceles]|nr:zinc finger protein, putative [Hepatocystis sp. ex Piliocolobus tephrosceles]